MMPRLIMHQARLNLFNGHPFIRRSFCPVRAHSATCVTRLYRSLLWQIVHLSSRVQLVFVSVANAECASEIGERPAACTPSAPNVNPY